MLSTKKLLYKVCEAISTLTNNTAVEDISAHITFNSAWTDFHRSAFKVGDMVYFVLEGYTSTFVAGTEYTMATIDSGYRPSKNYPFTGHLTDSEFKPVGIVMCFAKTDGTVTVRASDTSGNYFFVSGFYKIA